MCSFFLLALTSGKIIVVIIAEALLVGVGALFRQGGGEVSFDSDFRSKQLRLRNSYAGPHHSARRFHRGTIVVPGRLLVKTYGFVELSEPGPPSIRAGSL